MVSNLNYNSITKRQLYTFTLCILLSRWVWCEVTWENVTGNAIAVRKTFDCEFNHYT